MTAYASVANSFIFVEFLTLSFYEVQDDIVDSYSFLLGFFNMYLCMKAYSYNRSEGKCPLWLKMKPYSSSFSTQHLWQGYRLR